LDWVVIPSFDWIIAFNLTGLEFTLILKSIGLSWDRVIDQTFMIEVYGFFGFDPNQVLLLS